MLVAASRDPQLQKLAHQQGAKGINLAGICCTANEILMRHGIPIAGNFLQQELALATGAVDAMIVDVQCIMPALGQSLTVLPYEAHCDLSQSEIPRCGVRGVPRRARLSRAAKEIIQHRYRELSQA
jgi:hydroxylamine reductase (hybrid-cluster protein)